MSKLTRLRALAVASTVSVASSIPATSAGALPSETVPGAAACWPEWSDAAAIVEREKLAPARGVHSLARQHTGGDLVRITLCETGGAFFYRLLVRDRSGRVTTVVVDARRPFDR